MANDEKILIVGGGIAGLSLARALHWRGWSPRLIESRSEWALAGTGLYTPANGVSALEQLGLVDAARSRGFTISKRSIATAQGAQVLDLDLERVWGRQQPCLGIHRQALQAILLEGARMLILRSARLSLTSKSGSTGSRWNCPTAARNASTSWSALMESTLLSAPPFWAKSVCGRWPL